MQVKNNSFQMSWFADLAGKAENLLNNLDEQTGAVIRNHNVLKQKTNKHDKTEYVVHNEGNWNQKKRPIPRNLKRITPVTETRSSYGPSRKTSSSHQSRVQIKDPDSFLPENVKNGPLKSRKSPTRKSSPLYTLNNCPKTLVGDVKDEIIVDQFGLRQRRFSLPEDLELIASEHWTYKMQNLEVENAMLKNELNVMNREVADLLDRLRKTEDEFNKAHSKLESFELQTYQANLDKNSLASQLEQLKAKIQELTAIENEYEEEKQSLQMENNMLKDINKDLEDRVKELTEKTEEKNSRHIKLETELRHAQSTISDLQSDLQKSIGECRRLEKDWETYKLRVKSMLFSKDNQIKALQDGMNLNEDTKVLMEQMEALKDERNVLSEAIARVRGECSDMKQCMEQVEARNAAAERVVAALRDALREERAVRNRAEAQCIVLGKELKSLRMESGQTIASLQTALQDKESELNQLRDCTSSTVRSTDTSALNVADYDVMQDSIDNEKIHYLTETLVQRQGKIDALLADNNMLRIQLEKLQNKYKMEVSANARANCAHSVVHLQEENSRARRAIPSASHLAAISLKIGVMIKRYPIFRIFIIIYMICLHFWVLTVLFASTPEDYIKRPTKS